MQNKTVRRYGATHRNVGPEPDDNAPARTQWNHQMLYALSLC